MTTKNTTIVDIRDIKKIVNSVAENWYIMLAFILASIVLAYFYSYKLPRIYAAKTQLLLQNQETYNYQEGLFNGLGMYSSYEKMANEKKVISSTDIIAEAIRKLNMNVSYYIVGRIQTKEMYSEMPFSVEAKIYAQNFFETPFNFRIVDSDNFELSYEEDGKETKIKHRFGEPLINSIYYLVINKSSAINPQTISSLGEIAYQFVVHEPHNLVNKYKSIMEVENLDYTAILEVMIEDESSDRAVAFLDTLTKVYISNSLKTKIKVNENTIRDIDRQLGEVIHILDSIENMMEHFKESKSILDLTKDEEEFYKNLSANQITKRGLELQMKSLSYLKNYITANLNKELLPPSLYIADNDQYLKQAINELYNYQVKINSELFTTTEKSTSIKEVEYKIELLRNDILKYIVNTEKAINEKITAITDEIAFYEDKVKGVPGNQRQMLNITRKIQVNEKLYLYLLEKRAETVLARSGIISEISTIESAHSIGIVKPDVKKIYYSYISVAFVLSLAIVLLRSFIFSRIDNIEELREHTKMPVLGEIYYSKEADYLVVETHQKSFITEAFRNIRTNLEYLAPQIPSKVVLVTSNRPSVGKTFCSINLAAILAKGGKKVLLLDFDLHKPKIHTVLNIVSNTIGMSNLLIGKSSASESIIHSGIANLDVILSGPIPPNASELVLSKAVPDLLEYTDHKYDYIIVDTPPMGLISDALVLMKYSHINLFVVNTKHAPNESVNYAHNVSLNNKISTSFAFILNCVKARNSRYYYSKYEYGYGYDISKKA
jgi:tyrosine-protein kinase Etk/Wzc